MWLKCRRPSTGLVALALCTASASERSKRLLYALCAALRPGLEDSFFFSILVLLRGRFIVVQAGLVELTLQALFGDLGRPPKPSACNLRGLLYSANA